MRKILFPIFLLIIFLFPVLGEDLQKEDNQDYAQLAVSNLDYMVTVGDIYRLSYSMSGSFVSYEIMVDSSYNMRIGNFGIVKAYGKSYQGFRIIHFLQLFQGILRVYRKAFAFQK